MRAKSSGAKTAAAPATPAAKAPEQSAPVQVAKRVDAIVDQIKKQLADGPSQAADYEFEIIRDHRGLIQKVIARVINPTTH